MLLTDVNVLLSAHRSELPDHEPIRSWLTNLIDGDSAFGVPELAMSAFVRIATASKPFRPPTQTGVAFDFCRKIVASPRCVIVRPSPSHWQIFERLCRQIHATGNLVPDAYFAAMAIDSGCEWITLDNDFARFPALTWRHPLAKTATTNRL